MAIRSALDEWWAKQEPIILAEAERRRAAAEGAALAKVEEIAGSKAAKTVEASLPILKAFVEPIVEKGLDRGEEVILAKVEAKAAEVRGKQERGEPLTPMDYFWLYLAASGIGAGGVSAGKGILRRVLGLKVPVDRQDPPKT